MTTKGGGLIYKMKSIYSTSTWDFPLWEWQCVTGEEALLIFLHHIRHRYSICSAADTIFGGSSPSTFVLFWIISTNNFYHKISGDSMSQWTDDIDDFCHAIHNKFLMVLYGDPGWHSDWFRVYIPYETFQIFGWLDDTDIAHNATTAGHCSCNDNINQREELREIQVAFYK
jgi:hypothetical protein